MDPMWLMITLVTAMGVAIPLLAIWTRHKKDVIHMELRLAAEKAAQGATENEQLKERLRVLERIVTDKGYDVATQIDALRDSKRVEYSSEEGHA